jgi:hypothetical protein
MRAAVKTSRRHAALGAALVVVLLPAPAYAAACFMSAAAYGVGRLKNWESAAAGSTLSGVATLGAWRTDGSYSPMVGAITRDPDARPKPCAAPVSVAAPAHRCGGAHARAAAQHP